MADVALTRTPVEKGLSVRLLREPDWRLPSLVESLLDAPLRYPFEGPGSEVDWAARKAPGGGTFLVGRYRALVRETWIPRWLAGLVGQPPGEFRREAEREADLYYRDCLLALRNDLRRDLRSIRPGQDPSTSPR